MFKKTGTRTTTVIIIVTIIISDMVIVVIIINMTPSIIIITGVTIATQTRSIYMDSFFLLTLNGILHRLIMGNLLCRRIRRSQIESLGGLWYPG